MSYIPMGEKNVESAIGTSLEREDVLDMSIKNARCSTKNRACHPTMLPRSKVLWGIVGKYQQT